MKKDDNSEIDKILADAPAIQVSLVKVSHNDKNVDKQPRSRITLVKMGKKILPQIYKLLKSADVKLRMEAAKIIEQSHLSLGATTPVEASRALGPVIYNNKLL